MADRTAAGIFGTLFQQLAEDFESASADAAHADRREYILTLAREMWGQRWNYDFSHYQMECDDALIQLGLADDSDRTRMYRSRDCQTWEAG